MFQKGMTVLNTGIESAREGSKGIQQSLSVTGTMKHVANVASGKAFIDAIEQNIPPVNHSLKLFAKGVAFPAKLIAEPLVSAAFSFAIRRSVRGAVKSYYVHSIGRVAISSVVQYGLSLISEEVAKSGIGDSITNFALGMGEEAFIKYASAKILELLEPLIHSGADLIAAETGRIAKNSVKVYFGNLLLLYLTSLVLSLLHDDTAGMLRTTVNYAQDLDSGWYCLLIVMLTMAAHLLPVMGRVISPTLQKQHTKSDLKEYIILKSQQEGEKDLDGRLYQYVVGIVVDTLVDSNLIDSNQIQLALNSIKLGEEVTRATFSS